MVEEHRDISLSNAAQRPVNSSDSVGGVLFLLIVIAAILYGSFLPFARVPHSWSLENGLGVFKIAWRATTWDDVITNVLCYLPVGFGVAYFGLRKRSARVVEELKGERFDTSNTPIRAEFMSLIYTVGLCGALSTMIECAQLGIVGRVASWSDVAFNVVGGAIGFATARVVFNCGAGAMLALQLTVMKRPCTLVCWVLTTALLLAHSDSFRFVTDDASFHANLGRSAAHFLTGGSIDARSMSLGQFFALVISAVWFCALGYFSALSNREADLRPTRAFEFSVFHAITVAALSWVFHLLSRTSVLPWSMLMVWGLAVGFGSWIAVFVIDKGTRSGWRTRRRLAAPTVLLVVAVGFLTGAIIGHALAGADPMSNSYWMDGVQLPFHGLWRLPIHEAAGQLVGQVGMLVCLIFASSILVRRMGLAASWGVAGLLATLLVVASQALVYYRTGGCDVTAVILAVVVTVVAKQAYVALHGQPQVAEIPRQ